MSPVTMTLVVILQTENLYYYPGFELAVENENLILMKHGKLQLAIDLLRSNQTISDQTVADLTAHYYYRKRPRSSSVILITNINSLGLLLMASLAHWWNIPMVNIGGSNPGLANKEKYSTSLSLCAVENSVMVDFVRIFLRNNNWSTVFLLCDNDVSHNRGFYPLIYELLRKRLRNDRFTAHDMVFDSSTADNSTYDLILKTMKQQARIIVVLANHLVTRNILIRAFDKNMTGDEYVYFFLQPLLKRPYYLPLNWSLNDKDEDKARQAFKTVIYITADTSTLKTVISEEEKQKVLSRVHSLQEPVLEDDVPVENFAFYETVAILSQKISDDLVESKQSSPNNSSRIDGQSFVRGFFNKSFHLSYGDVYIDEVGRKLPDYVLRQFDVQSSTFRDVVRYNGGQQTLTFPFGREFLWPNGITPADEPRCGFLGDKPGCEGKRSTLMAVGFTIAAVFFASSAVFTALWYAARRSLSLLYTFALLSPNDFALTQRSIVAFNGSFWLSAPLPIRRIP